MSDDFERITIVSVNGVTERVAGALNALLLSSRHLPGAQCLLLSPYLPEAAPRHVKHVRIAPLGYLEYSLFVLYCLSEFVTTDFALIVQDDGWVLNPNRWQPTYLDYDVVGAPAHIARVHAPHGTQYMVRFTWATADPNWPVDMVLNGGFSLRSRRALQMPKALGIPYQVPPPVSEPQDSVRAIKYPDRQANEDVQMCTLMRAALESAGLRFAPLEVAKHFSIEHAARGIHDRFNLGELFGHHSSHRKLISIDPLVVRYKTSEQETANIPGEEHVIALLKQLGYELQFAQSAAIERHKPDSPVH